MDNIHKVINLNGFISDLKQYYYIVTSYEVAYNTYIEKYKVYTFFYGDYEFSILIVDNRYRLVDYKGDFYESDNIEDFKNIVKWRLWRVYGDI